LKRAAARALLYRMKQRTVFCMVVTLAGCLLGDGCRTAPKGEAPSTADSPGHGVPAKRAKGKVSPPKLASAHAHYAAGVVHEMNGETDLALQEFERAAADDPDNQTLILEVSRRMLQFKQPEKALEFLQAATARGKADGEVYARLGIVYTRLGRNEEALAANRMAIKKSPRSLAGYRNLFQWGKSSQPLSAHGDRLRGAFKVPRARQGFSSSRTRDRPAALSGNREGLFCRALADRPGRSLKAHQS